MQKYIFFNCKDLQQCPISLDCIDPTLGNDTVAALILYAGFINNYTVITSTLGPV